MKKFNVPTDNYFCVINGNELKKYYPKMKPILAKCLREAVKGNYVELWYCNTNGQQHIIKYWN